MMSAQERSPSRDKGTADRTETAHTSGTGDGNGPVGGGGIEGRERGSATVWALAVGMVTLLVAVAVSAVGSAIVARHRAQQAADLAALAGAASALLGEPAACARAAELAGANGATMVSCHLEGLDLTVSAAVAMTNLPVPAMAATASARAGPADTEPPEP